MQEMTVTLGLSVPDDMDGYATENMIEDAFFYVKDQAPNSSVYPNAAKILKCRLNSVSVVI